MASEAPIKAGACDRDPLCLLESAHSGECEFGPEQHPAFKMVAGYQAALPTPSVNVESLLAQAVVGKVPVETLERLLALRDKLNAERAKADFTAALARFQARCPVIPKNKIAKGQNFSYPYADIPTIIQHAGPILAEEGFSYRFTTSDDETHKTVYCHLMHVGGHEEVTPFRVPIDKAARMNDVQKDGSSNTYAKRYAFCNATGIMTGDADDDGNAGTATEPPKFGTPPRKSATHIEVQRRIAEEEKAAEREPGSDDVPPEIPADAISEKQAKRLYALIRDALVARGQYRDENLNAVTAELDRRTQKRTGRARWEHLPRKHYEKMCEAIETIVAGIVP